MVLEIVGESTYMSLVIEEITSVKMNIMQERETMTTGDGDIIENNLKFGNVALEIKTMREGSKDTHTIMSPKPDDVEKFKKIGAMISLIKKKDHDNKAHDRAVNYYININKPNWGTNYIEIA